MQLREQDPLCEGCLVAGTDADRAARLRFLDERNPTIAALRGLRDRSERTLALEGTAPSREIVAARVAARRTLRRLDRSWIGRLARRRRARAAMNAPSW